MQSSRQPQRHNGNRRSAPTLVVSIGRGKTRAMMEIIKIARLRGWDVMDLRWTGGLLPADYTPTAAIISDMPDSPLGKQLLERGCCTVREGWKRHPMDNVVPVVMVDQRAEGQLAAEHFAERGFHSVGVVTLYGLDRRAKAFRDHAVALGLQFHHLEMPTAQCARPEAQSKRYARQQASFGRWVSKISEPIGIMSNEDTWAAQLCEMCLHEGIRVPEDVAILGRGNDVTICECTPVRLSSIHMDTERRIDTVFELLDHMLAGHPPPGEPVLIAPKWLEVRESTDVRASRNSDVAEALRYIWNHYDDLELSVGGIAETMHFSRRKLERLFRAELGQSVNEVLLGRRLDCCCRLLRMTDINVSDLCWEVGLRSKDYLHRAFKRTYGMTPRQYRRSLPDSGDLPGASDTPPS